MGPAADQLTFAQDVTDGWSIQVPAGTWHDVINTGEEPMRLYVVYAPSTMPKDGSTAPERTQRLTSRGEATNRRTGPFSRVRTRPTSTRRPRATRGARTTRCAAITGRTFRGAAPELPVPVAYHPALEDAPGTGLLPWYSDIGSGGSRSGQRERTCRRGAELCRDGARTARRPWP